MIVALVLAGMQEAQGVRPRVADVRLRVGASVVAPVDEGRVLVSETRCEGGSIVESVAGIEWVRGGERVALDVPAGAVTFLCADGTTAWFRSDAAPLELWPVGLADGKRREPWKLDDAALGLGSATASSAKVVDAACEGTKLFVERLDVAARHIVGFDAKSGERKWVRTLPLVAQQGSPEAVLLAPMGTPAARGDLRTFTPLGSLLVLTTGPEEPLLALDVESGKERWRIERLWEFERGYIGPSVWQHHVGRFGRFEIGADESEAAAVKARRVEFEARSVGKVAWGPFAIERDGWRKEKALLVVATTAPRDEWPDQREQAWLYEISEYGQVVSVAALPRRPRSSSCTSFDDRVVVSCTKGAFACFAGTRVDYGDFPGSGHDALAKIAWFREFDAPPTKAWLASDPANRAAAFSPELVVQALDGGRIERQDEKVLRFPLLLLDPATGNSREAELRVPFDGEITRPDTNVSSDGTTTRTWGPRGLGVTGLATADGRLQVTLANEKEPWTVTFAVADVLAAR
ncbi:MAG: hypothetical protein NTV21_04810 [Planctomycetota bacterium]|nr:hypothetical protein [Planctomycetota bacterium]